VFFGGGSIYNSSLSRLNVISCVLLVLLVATSAYPQQSRSPRLPPYFYGTWTIYRFVEVLGHAGETKERAETQIGKTLKIGLHSFDHDNNIHGLENTPCKYVNYKHTMETSDDLDKGTLSFYGLETEYDHDDLIFVSCNQQIVFAVELAKNRELAAYYDGWFFFLRKATTVSEP
jgi:hypothetical protein